MNAKNILGWFTVVVGTLAATFWAFWGTFEAFHEGWSKPQLWMRLLQTAAYLGPATVLCSMTAVGIRWPRMGAVQFFVVGAAIAVLIRIDKAQITGILFFSLTVTPLLVGLLFLFGRPKPRRLALAIAIGLPGIMVIACGIEPVFLVSTRFDDCDRGARLVEGNGVTLLWVPAGPGWSRDGNVTWDKALDQVSRLTADGLSLADEPQNIWRLPTRGEIVRSLTRNNLNAGGTWNAENGQASYKRKPDKESPLWDPFAPLVYLWTSEQRDDDHAWIVVYHGGIYAKSKSLGSPSFGFRAVLEPMTE